jgi:hypothetical protein
MSMSTRVSKVMVWRLFMMKQNVKGKNEGWQEGNQLT